MPTLTAKCACFTRLPNPLEDRGIKNYYAIVDVDSIFNLADWRETNVRDPKDSGYVPDQIRKSLLEQDTFFLINRGLAISAESVQHDNRTNTLHIVVSNNQVHGLMDGGHTYLQLEKFKQIKDEREVDPQYVKIEIVTGLDRTRIVNLVDGRNTSNQVKEVSLENLRDSFKELKRVLDGQPYGDKIAYSEYETTTNGGGRAIAKPVSVMEVLKCLVCLDIKNFDDTQHPVEIGTRNNKVIAHFKDHEEELRPLYTLLPSMLHLWDTIGESFVPCYNQGGGKAGKIGGTDNRFFKRRSKPAKLYFLGKTSEWSFADGLRLPVFSAFRSAIRFSKSSCSWRIDDPSRFFVESLGSKLTRVVCQNLIDTQDVTRTVRAESVWAHCYTEAELAVLKSGDGA
jgi:hypothetical protein